MDETYVHDWTTGSERVSKVYTKVGLELFLLLTSFVFAAWCAWTFWPSLGFNLHKVDMIL